MTRDLQSYRRSVYSQNGEDGVIAEICRRWGVDRGWFCEFGAWDGRYGSNTYNLLKHGWKGVMIEGDPAKFKALERTARNHQDALWIIESFVEHEDGDNSLNKLLQRTPTPHDFDVLSIDIDSCDYHVWRSLDQYRPKLIIIEIDSSTPPGEEYVYDGSGRLTSFSAMLKLGQSKGYTLVCHTGNMFFVADEHVAALGVDASSLMPPERLFISEWLNPTKLDTWKRKVKNLSWQRVVVKLDNMARK